MNMCNIYKLDTIYMCGTDPSIQLTEFWKASVIMHSTHVEGRTEICFGRTDKPMIVIECYLINRIVLESQMNRL